MRAWNEKYYTRLFKYKEYVLLAIIAVAAGLVFGIAYFLKEQFSAVMTVESFLAWHNILEFTSVLISFTVFAVSYYTYEQPEICDPFFWAVFFLQ